MVLSDAYIILDNNTKVMNTTNTSCLPIKY